MQNTKIIGTSLKNGKLNINPVIYINIVYIIDNKKATKNHDNQNALEDRPCGINPYLIYENFSFETIF